MSEVDRFRSLIDGKVNGSRQAQLHSVKCKSVQWDNTWASYDDGNRAYQRHKLSRGDD